MSEKLLGKKVVIIGGASEMARATIRIILDQGADLMLVDYNQKALAAMEQEFSPYQGRVSVFPADVTKPEQMEAAVEAAVRRMGRLDVLVNIAGIIRHHPVDEMPYEDWCAVLNVNLTGYFLACRYAVPHMKSQRYGRIVNIASIGGRTGRPGCGCNYAASKAGVVGLTQTLAKELGPWSITVNAIAPGPLKGSMFFSMTEKQQKDLGAGIPLGDLGDMEQIAYSIAFLASDEASYITGEVLDVNGGLYI